MPRYDHKSTVIASQEERENMRIGSNDERTRRLALRTLGGCVAAWCVWLTLASGPAWGKLVHEKTGSFNGETTLNAAGEEVSGGAIPGGGPFGEQTGFSDYGGAFAIASDGSGHVLIGESNAYAQLLALYYHITTESAVYRFTGEGGYGGMKIAGAEAPARFWFGSTTEPAGIAVDTSGGENSGFVYVADRANDVIDVFNEEGAYECQITGKPTPSATECDKAGSATETTEGGFAPYGVAVNNSGDVFVADHSHNAIDEFAPSGAFVKEITEHIKAPTAIATGPSGAIYVIDKGREALKLSASGAYEATIDANSPTSVAVDPTSGYVYLYDKAGGTASQIVEYEPNGTLRGTFGAGEKFGSSAVLLAVNAATGAVYALKAEFLPSVSTVYVYSPDIVEPNVTTGAPTSVSETTATLNGEAGPDSAHGGKEVAKCWFEYVSQKEFEAKGFEGAATATCEQALPYTNVESVSANVTGLTAATNYHVRLAAEDAGAVGHVSVSENEEQFKTKGKPVVDTESVSGITRTEAQLEAEINPDGFATEYQFEYGPCEGECAGSAYPDKAPASPAAVGAGEQPVATSQPISGLRTHGRYHYRVVADNSQGEATGPERTFVTLPVAGVEYTSAIAQVHTATIKARIDPAEEVVSLGDATTCAVQYVSEETFNVSGFDEPQTTTCRPSVLPAESEGTNVIVDLGGLTKNTVYHYRVVVSNEAGEEAPSGEQTFATFGFAAASVSFEDKEGGAYTQAGGHPYEMTTKIVFPSTTDAAGDVTPSGAVRDVRVALPPGFVGNPAATAKCAIRDAEDKRCSGASQVGVISVQFFNGQTEVGDIFNLVPPKGVAADFGGRVNRDANAYIEAHLRTGTDYGVDADSLNITGLEPVVGVTVTMWGVPADRSHDAERGCPVESSGEGTYTTPCEERGAPVPFLTNPTQCTGAQLTTTLEADSYQASGEYVTKEIMTPKIEGCGKLHFNPSIAVTPRASSTDSPSGLEVDLKVPQAESAKSFAEADLKNATVTLPKGLTVNPASAAGLSGCSEAQVGYLPAQSAPPGELRFTAAPAECPGESKIGTVVLKTQLYPEKRFEGGIYVAQQGNGAASLGSNPFGSLLAIYLAINEPETGVVIKLAGHVEVLARGQLRTTFDNNPQLPFEELTLKFFGGKRAPLATPRSCGSYTTSSLLEPWSHEVPVGEAGTPNAEPTSAFDIGSGPGGSACASPGFAPSFSAGTSNNQAGGYSPFTMTLSRRDGEQRLSTVSMTMPKGVAGMLSKVPLCSEVQAKADGCSSASQIGHVVAEVGVGSQPDTLPEPGRQEDPVYLLGPTEGAPFGLAIVVHPEAGPFNLEEDSKPVIVLAKLEVDQTTAQVTVVSKPMPTMLQGIPIDLKTVHVVVGRPDFMFNPTSCEPMSVAGIVGSAEGASASVSSRFQAAGCRGLAFKPGFKVLIHAHHTRQNGLYAHFVVTSGSGQANIGSVKVKLPGRLPARESTLKQACTEAQFAKDPAGCPAGSKVGTATARTPVLPVPLRGRAIFVSHGGAAYPDLDLVLKGDGVTVVLTGNTHINSKTGVTTSYFKTVPDVPISQFDLVLPAKANSALGGTGNLCYKTKTVERRVRVRRHGRWVHVVRKVRHRVRRHLMMPTTITGQNGAVVERKTKVAVTGCGKAKAKGARHKGHRGQGRHHRKH